MTIVPVDVQDSILPPGASTADNQDLAIAILHAIQTLLAAGLPTALVSDALKVREQATVTVQATGADKIHAIESARLDPVNNMALNAGYQILSSTLVPAGKMWRITQITWDYGGTPPARVYIVATSGGLACLVKEWQTPVSDRYYDLQTEIWLAAGGAIELHMHNATGGDYCRLHICGYQMDAP